jgi:hypothetical protein
MLPKSAFDSADSKSSYFRFSLSLSLPISLSLSFYHYTRLIPCLSLSFHYFFLCYVHHRFLQIVWALFIAQREVELTHYDLHFKNILLLPLPPSVSCCLYLHDGRVWKTKSDIIKISGDV